MGSFTILNIAQFLLSMNVSILRAITVFFLIDLLGIEQSNQILALSSALVILPFLLFSIPAGQLADKISKRSLVIWTLFFQSSCIAYSLLAFATRIPFHAYASLCAVGLSTALFSPAKYSILPEIVPREGISRANGILTFATYVAVILGTFLASWVSELTGRSYTEITALCLFLSLVAWVLSFWIQKTAPQNPSQKISFAFLSETFATLKEARKVPNLFLTCWCTAYFLFVATYIQLNSIPFGIQSLGITDVQTGYLFLAPALGIGIGSLVVSFFAGCELGLAVFGSALTGCSFIAVYFSQTSIIASSIAFFLVGMNGALFIVPLDAYLQIASPAKERGQIVAVSTLLGFVCAFLAAVFLKVTGDWLSLSAAFGYCIVGIAILGLSLYLMKVWGDEYARFIATAKCRLFYRVERPEMGKTGLFVVPSKRHLPAFLQFFEKIICIKLVAKRPLFRFGNTLLLKADEVDQSEKLNSLKEQGYSFYCISEEPAFIDQLRKKLSVDIYHVNISPLKGRNVSITIDRKTSAS